MDRWCGDEPLGEAFPVLFSIASIPKTHEKSICGSKLGRGMLEPQIHKIDHWLGIRWGGGFFQAI